MFTPDKDKLNGNIFCREQTTRHLYYLQLRRDVLDGNVYVHEETALLLASYALQAEINDHNTGGPSSLYFAPEKYLPQRVGKLRFTKTLTTFRLTHA